MVLAYWMRCAETRVHADGARELSGERALLPSRVITK